MDFATFSSPHMCRGYQSLIVTKLCYTSTSGYSRLLSLALVLASCSQTEGEVLARSMQSQDCLFR